MSRRRCVCFIRNHTHLDHFDVARQATLNRGICIARVLVIREWLDACRGAISVFGGRTWEITIGCSKVWNSTAGVTCNTGRAIAIGVGEKIDDLRPFDPDLVARVIAGVA